LVNSRNAAGREREMKIYGLYTPNSDGYLEKVTEYDDLDVAIYNANLNPDYENAVILDPETGEVIFRSERE
jgi:hypothetical protein